MRYRAAKRPPLWIVSGLAVITLFWFFQSAGWNALLKPYFWPGFVLTPFFLFCAISGKFAPWHKAIWRCAQVWCGFWTGLFMVSPLQVVWPAIWLWQMGITSGEPESPFIALPAGLLMLAFGTVLVRFGFYLSRNEAAFLKDFLATTIGTRDDSAPV